eukprot:GHVL01038411.1.p1 GENE.GHVL01038411.1~~GHVL01038411.1.p1  ORF type:complete len:340 (+),score=79.22 GHVL01038411.1:38-1057(+)
MTTNEETISKKNKYRRDKPWDIDGIDHWKVERHLPDDSPACLVDESSFSTLFPKYRETYLKEVWPDVEQILKEHHIKAELDLVEGSMQVKTRKKTWDPYIIIKARDLIKLLARSVPLPQAKRILEDEMFSDLIKMSGLVKNRERLVKRRQRLVGPNGSTLKAIELLTNCYVLVQGQTVAVMGSIKGLKRVRLIVEECMKNVHPVYHIKELMIRRELENDPQLKNESWDRFLPQFKKRNLKRKKIKIEKKKRSLFPPEQTPRKEDLMLESGEWFVNETARQSNKRASKMEEQQNKTAKKRSERQEEFVPPSEEKPKKKKKTEKKDIETANLIEKLKKKKK